MGNPRGTTSYVPPPTPQAVAPAASAPSISPSSQQKRRSVIATLLGNALEGYDFAIYAFFSVTIGQLFFPSHSASNALLLSVTIYGVGFIARPLGALVFGMYADRYGRRSALTWALALMGVGTLTIACAPTHAQLGTLSPLAPWLLVAGRLLQGFSQGGEVGTAYATLLEIDPHRGRGFRAALDLSSSALAGVCAAGTVVLITHTLLPETILAWGWRIPFFIGALAAPAGLALRAQLHDDRPITRPAPLQHIWHALLAQWKILLLCILAVQGTVTAFVMAGYYLPVHAMHWLGLELKTVHWIGIASSSTLLIFSPLFGLWSDGMKRRKPLALGGRLVSALVFIPAYGLINRYPSLLVIMAMAATMKFFLGMASATTAALIAESFPREIRATATCVCYAAATTISGGTTQILAVATIKWSGILLAPAIYASGWLLLSAAAVTLLKETARHAVD